MTFKVGKVRQAAIDISIAFLLKIQLLPTNCMSAWPTRNLKLITLENILGLTTLALTPFASILEAQSP